MPHSSRWRFAASSLVAAGALGAGALLCAPAGAATPSSTVHQAVTAGRAAGSVQITLHTSQGGKSETGLIVIGPHGSAESANAGSSKLSLRLVKHTVYLKGSEAFLANATP